MSDPGRHAALFDGLPYGAGLDFKPFECVGDPNESAVALVKVSQLSEWADVKLLTALAEEVSPDRTFEELLESQGRSHVPAHWLR